MTIWKNVNSIFDKINYKHLIVVFILIIIKKRMGGQANEIKLEIFVSS